MTIHDLLIEALKSGQTLSKKIDGRNVLQHGRYAYIRGTHWEWVDQRSAINYKVGLQYVEQAPIVRSSDGKVLMQAVPSADASLELLVNHLHALLQNEQRHLILIIENSKARRGNTFLSSFAFPVFYYHNEVYHIASQSDTIDMIEDKIEEAEAAWNDVGFLAEIPDQYIHNQDLPEHTLNAMANNILLMYAREFDMEGYILWQDTSL